MMPVAISMQLIMMHIDNVKDVIVDYITELFKNFQIKVIHDIIYAIESFHTTKNSQKHKQQDLLRVQVRFATA